MYPFLFKSFQNCNVAFKKILTRNDWKMVEIFSYRWHGSLLLTEISKVFDCIDHQFLIAKLKAHGIDTNSLYLLPSYLKKRKQRTSLSNSNYFTSSKKCRRESCIMDFTSAKMEFAPAIFKKLHCSNYSIKRCCKRITSIQKLVWPYK